MRKPLCLVDQDPILKQFNEERVSLKQRCEQKQQFIEKQVENLKKEWDEGNDSLWEKIEAHLKSLNLLPADYAESDKMHLHLDDGVIFFCDGDHKIDPQDLIKALFSSMKKD